MNPFFRLPALALLLALLVTSLTGCDVIADIFKAGFYTAFILIALIAVLILWLIRRAR